MAEKEYPWPPNGIQSLAKLASPLVSGWKFCAALPEAINIDISKI
jgi:hypothetical protein